MLPFIIKGLCLNNEKSIFRPDLPGRPSPGSDLQEKQSRAGKDRCPVRGSRADDHRRWRLRDQLPRPVREAAGVRRPNHPGQRDLRVRLPGHLRFRHAFLRVHLRRLVQGLRPRHLHGLSPARLHEDAERDDGRHRQVCGRRGSRTRLRQHRVRQGLLRRNRPRRRRGLRRRGSREDGLQGRVPDEVQETQRLRVRLHPERLRAPRQRPPATGC